MRPFNIALALLILLVAPAEAVERARSASTAARLKTEATAPARPEAEAGTFRLDAAGGRGAVVHVPPGYSPDRPAPLLLLLHGAGGSGALLLPLVQAHAERLGAIVLAPDSRGPTWDAIRGAPGPDIAFLDKALAWTYERFAVDPARQAVAGFSDGASYALMLGLANGDRFPAVLAWSPGFIPAQPVREEGEPRFFVTHGTADPVLEIAVTSRRIVPALRRGGATVEYREFEGGHVLKGTLLAESLDWAFGGAGR